jgi:hypothetical protein
VSERGDQWEDHDQDKRQHGVRPGQTTDDNRPGATGESEGQEGTNRGNRESGSGPGSPGNQGEPTQDQPGATEDPSAD